MKTALRHSSELSSNSSFSFPVPKGLSRKLKRLHELQSNKDALMKVVQQNDRQRLSFLKNGDYIVAKQLFHTNEAIGRELRPISQEIKALERAISS